MPSRLCLAALALVASAVRWPRVACLGLSDAAEGQPTGRIYNGTYTIVNKASGRRIQSGAMGFLASSRGHISDESLWRFALQENGSYSIVNVGNQMRILAQADRDFEDGFFAIAQGPVYQDQKWHVLRQNDGSHIFVNVRSGRRLLARRGHEAAVGFAAMAGEGEVLDDQTWWLINQERDEAGRLWVQLEMERTEAARRADGAQAQRDEASRFAAQAWEAQGARAQAAAALKTQQEDSARLLSQLDSERRISHQLSKQLEASRSEASRMGRELEETRFNWRAPTCKIAPSQASTLEPLALPPLAPWLLKGVEAMDTRHASITAVAILLVAAAALSTLWRRQRACLAAEDSAAAMQARAQELTGAGATAAQEDFDVEVCHVVTYVDSGAAMKTEFSHRVFHVESDGEVTRLVKIQCPGVEHGDVLIQLIFNGCDVSISRRASPGVEAVTWKKRFQFGNTDSLFEFKEDQMQLESGFLQLVFRGYSFRSRAIRFPQHYSLAATDTDFCWECAVEESASAPGISLGNALCANAAGNSDDGQSTAASSRGFAKAAL